MKNNERDERKTRKVLVPLATLAVAAAVAVGSGATFTSTSHSKIVVTSGKVVHSNTSGNDITLNVTQLVPAKSASGTLTITNDGDVPSVLTLERTAASSGFTNLTLAIDEVLSTGTNMVVGETPFPNAAGSPQDLDSDFQVGESHEYRFTVSLPTAAGNEDQGKTAKATFEFVTTQQDTAPVVSGWNN